MRTLALIALAGLAAASRADVIQYLSEERVVTFNVAAISGLGDSAFDSGVRNPAEPFAPFHEEALGEAIATLGSAVALASQDSWFDGDALIANGWAEARVSTSTLDDPVWGHVCGTAGSDALSRYRITFRVAHPGQFAISGSNSPNVVTTLTDAGGHEVFSAGQADQYHGRFLLAVGDYTLEAAAYSHGYLECVDEEFMTSEYFSLSFGHIPCQPDMNADGILNVFDFLQYQNAFSEGNLGADFNEDGALNVFDFLAFQTAFSQGC